MNELRVFVSSTFRDLQEERQDLVKKMSPEIGTLNRERGITTLEEDLRWRLTGEGVAFGRVISTCLDGVVRCRPYFIGSTSDRYCSVDTYLDAQRDPQRVELYP